MTSRPAGGLTGRRRESEATRNESGHELEARVTVTAADAGRWQAGPQPGRTAWAQRTSRARPDRPRRRNSSGTGNNGPATRTVATHRAVIGPDSDGRESRLGWRGRGLEPGRQHVSQRWNQEARCRADRAPRPVAPRVVALSTRM